MSLPSAEQLPWLCLAACPTSFLLTLASFRQPLAIVSPLSPSTAHFSPPQLLMKKLWAALGHSKIKLNKGFLCAGSEAHLRLSLPHPRTAPLLSALPCPHQCSNLRVLGEKFVLHLPRWQNKSRSWSRVRGKSKERKDNLIARPALAALTMRVAKDNWTTVRWQQILLIFSLHPSHKLLLLAYFAFNFQSANYARVPQIWEEREAFTLEWRELGGREQRMKKIVILLAFRFSVILLAISAHGQWRAGTLSVLRVLSFAAPIIASCPRRSVYSAAFAWLRF